MQTPVEISPIPCKTAADPTVAVLQTSIKKTAGGWLARPWFQILDLPNLDIERARYEICCKRGLIRYDQQDLFHIPNALLSFIDLIIFYSIGT
jgi:hypothetical protein